MKFEEIYHGGSLMGFAAKSQSCIYFFGAAECSLSHLKTLFPQLRFATLTQVHGDELVPASIKSSQTADAHWSAERNLGLVIQTADCMPVLFGTKSFVVAAHAGWRGVAQGLVEKCARFVVSQSGEAEATCIGPHIQGSEFEVGVDVANQLLSASDMPQAVHPHPNPEKRLVDLSMIASRQIRKNLKAAPIIMPMSTLSDERFHSYRRGKAKDARQYSFIARV